MLGIDLYYGIVDFSKAFDSVDHDVLLCRLLQMGFDYRVVDMLQQIYKASKAHVKFERGISEGIPLKRGVKQGDILSPDLFDCLILFMAEFIRLRYTSEVCIQGMAIFALLYADDIVLFGFNKVGM